MHVAILRIPVSARSARLKQLAQALKALDGVTEVHMGTRSGEAIVHFDERVTGRDELDRALRRASQGRRRDAGKGSKQERLG